MTNFASSSPTPIPKPSYSKREASRFQILDAATALVKERGYHSITMTEVAESSHVSRATLYRYYSTKEQLYNDAAGQWAINFIDDVRYNPPTEATAGERIQHIIRRLVNAVDDNHRLMTAYIASMISDDPASNSVPTRQKKALMPTAMRLALGRTQSENQALAVSILQHILVSNILLLSSDNISKEAFIDEMENIATKLLADIWDKP